MNINYEEKWILWRKRNQNCAFMNLLFTNTNIDFIEISQFSWFLLTKNIFYNVLQLNKKSFILKFSFMLFYTNSRPSGIIFHPPPSSSLIWNPGYVTLSSIIQIFPLILHTSPQPISTWTSCCSNFFSRIFYLWPK